MLALEIETLLREQIDVDLALKQFRPPRFSQRALAKSFNGGGLQPSRLVSALWAEIDLLGSTVLEAMRKVLSVSKTSPDDGSVEDLLRIFESEVDPVMCEIRALGGTTLAKISGEPEGWFEGKATLARKDWKIKIKLLRAEIMEAKRDGNRTVTFTVQNSNVGVIQAGEGSTVVGTTINFTDREKEKLRDALSQLTIRLENIESLSKENRTELREVALDLDAELAKTKPNGAKMRALLTGIVAGIKGIGGLVEIYKVVEAVLQAHGVHMLGN